jgi:hypothetical protein
LQQSAIRAIGPANYLSELETELLEITLKTEEFSLPKVWNRYRHEKQARRYSFAQSQANAHSRASHVRCVKRCARAVQDFGRSAK